MNPKTNTSPNNKSFGLLISSIFIILAIYYWLEKNQFTMASFFLSISFALLLITFFLPRILTPLSATWIFFGRTLGYVTQPLILGCIFFLLISPTGFLTRIFGRDELRLKRKKRGSYWVDRTPPGPTPESFHNQF